MVYNKRVSGFVIGKDSVRKQPTWKVRVKDRASSHNGEKLLVASVHPGVTLARGMNVLFEITEQLNAVAVAPVGVKTEGNPMRTIYKMGIIAALIIAIITAALQFNLHRHPTVRDFVVVQRAELALTVIKRLAFNDIVTDDVVRAAIRASVGNGKSFKWGGLRPALWDGRTEVFREHTCPIFGLGLYDNAQKTCRDARYYEGSRDPWGYNRIGVPHVVSGLMVKMREELYSNARAHLMTPSNLRAVFEAKKDIVQSEYQLMDTEKRSMFIERLDAMIAEFEQFRDNEILRTEWTHVLALEQNWREDTSENSTSFRTWQDAKTALRKKVPILYYYEFAGRRFLEGDMPIVEEYISLGKKLRNVLLAG